jgi:ferric iron reductase protein FhuF
MHYYAHRKYIYRKINVDAFCAFWYYFMYILPVFKELLEQNRRFTLTVDSVVRDFDVRDSDVRDFVVRDGSKQLRTLTRL